MDKYKFMKLSIMIPAYNEERSVARVIKEVKDSLAEYKEKYIIVINDGSNDKTGEEAVRAGADKVLHLKRNFGLANAFKNGLDQALSWGADIIVNTDADGQYNNRQIKDLIQPILEGRADIVIGDRQVKKLKHLPFAKKYGNLIGSFVVGCLTGIKNIDASSGFRAFSREAAFKINVFFGHTYTHQTIIEAAHKKMTIVSTPVDFKPRSHGQSRLIKGTLSHIRTSLFVIIRTLLIYKPLKTFVSIGSFCLLLAIILGVRFLYFYFFISGEGKIQSLILAAILAISGIIMYVIGFLGDLIALNRRLNEEILYRLKKHVYDEKNL